MFRHRPPSRAARPAPRALVPAARLGCRWALLGLACAAPALTAGADYATDIRPILESYCVKCHGPEKPKGGLNLVGFADAAAFQHDPKLLEMLLQRVGEFEMPPGGKPQPSAAERTQLLEWLKAVFEGIDFDKFEKNPGRVVLHRLSRLEYNNTVRDLFGVTNRPADKFPADGAGGGGFDNNADTLFIPPILLEKYLAAAEEVIEQAPAERLFLFKPGPLTSKRGAAARTLEHFTMRAFRRPLEPEERRGLLHRYDQAVRTGKSHEEAIKQVLRGILISPNFLFRAEAERAADKPYPITDYELASRLAYFFWSSMPDEELFRVAARGRLREPKTLEAQVRRMIHDPKAASFAESFASQWLGVRNLTTTAQPDPRRFPSYTPALRDAMYREPVEFFLALLREDRSLLDLLQADYTFLNEELARHYGITNIVGPELRRVPLTDPNRGGVVTMAGVLTITSYPLRTSPVLRGKWVLEEILGTPPPPPPPMVKGLPPDDAPKESRTFRQQLEAHRQKPECAACHQRMDPLGFGLENFDAIGRWRTEIGNQPVDASGTLVTGERFTGPAELKRLLLEAKRQFVRNLTEKMLAYALGRGLERYDFPTVKRLSETVLEHECRSSVLLTEIVKSYPFQYRRGSAPAISGRPLAPPGVAAAASRAQRPTQ